MPSNRIMGGNVITDADPLQVQNMGVDAVAANAAIGTTIDPAASATADENATARTVIGLLKGAKNILIDIAGLLAGILSVKIDQTTPGTTNKVTTDAVTATPTVYNVTLTNANTEYSQVLPAGCRMFEFQARVDIDIRFAFVTGKVATPVAPYMTLKAADYYWSPDLNQGAAPSTLYLASTIAGAVVQIIAWV